MLGAASNALVAAAPDPAKLAGLAPRATQLLTAPDPRLMVLFAVDHPSGFKNLMKVGASAKTTAERTVSLAHRLHTLAAVRNLVTHRASAGVATLAAFRKSYYSAFEDLVSLA